MSQIIQSGEKERGEGGKERERERERWGEGGRESNVSKQLDNKNEVSAINVHMHLIHMQPTTHLSAKHLIERSCLPQGANL